VLLPEDFFLSAIETIISAPGRRVLRAEISSRVRQIFFWCRVIFWRLIRCEILCHRSFKIPNGEGIVFSSNDACTCRIAAKFWLTSNCREVESLEKLFARNYNFGTSSLVIPIWIVAQNVSFDKKNSVEVDMKFLSPSGLSWLEAWIPLALRTTLRFLAPRRSLSVMVWRFLVSCTRFSISYQMLKVGSGIVCAFESLLDIVYQEAFWYLRSQVKTTQKLSNKHLDMFLHRRTRRVCKTSFL